MEQFVIAFFGAISLPKLSAYNIFIAEQFNKTKIDNFLWHLYQIFDICIRFPKSNW